MVLNKNSLVSILMTNYNDGEFIEEAIKSIVNQSYSPIEMIIIDDGSTDNSKEVIEELKTKYVNRFSDFKTEYKKNGGINDALNVGIRMINGKYVIIFDSDDILDKDYIKITVEKLINSKLENLGFVYTNCILINNLGKEIGFGKFEEFNKDLLKSKSCIPTIALMKTKALKSAFPQNINIKVATNFYRYQDISRAGFTGLHISKNLFYYRMHENNISGTGSKIFNSLNNHKIYSKSIFLSDYWQGA